VCQKTVWKVLLTTPGQPGTRRKHQKTGTTQKA